MFRDLHLVAAALMLPTGNTLANPFNSFNGPYVDDVEIVPRQAPSGDGPPPYNIGIKGPVITSNFPDPCILNRNGTWYAFGTETYGSPLRIKQATSKDFIHWTVTKGYDALAHLPSWANQTTQGNIFAPDVSELPDGTFIMYFSALVKNRDGIRCIGAAKSKTVQGPYNPVGDAPIICNPNGGANDPSGFSDWVDGLGDPKAQRYIIYQNINPGTSIMIRPVADDGVTFMGRPSIILVNRGDVDGGTVNGPNMVKKGARDYYLFFNIGEYTSSIYSIQYATARSPQGPWTRRGTLVSSGKGVRGPGGVTFANGGNHLAFAGLLDNAKPVPNRGMYVATAQLGNRKATITGPR